jgi:hypothetical protein
MNWGRYSRRIHPEVKSGVNDRGFLTSSLATSVAIIALHHITTSFKDVSILRLGLTFFFLVTVTLFVGGQTSALTFTAVSVECTERNTLALVADLLARVSALIIGLNVFARARFRWARYSLVGWAVFRIGNDLLGQGIDGSCGDYSNGSYL